MQMVRKYGVRILLLVLLFHPHRSQADFHLVQIDEIMAGLNGDANIQFFEINMSGSGQNCQGTGNHPFFGQTGDSSNPPCDTIGPGARLIFFDAAGNLTGEFLFPGNTPEGLGGRSVLIATQQFADLGTMPQPDFIMPPLIQPNNGKVCYRNRDGAPFIINLCISYGNFTGNTEGFGAPAPALPITGNTSLKRVNFNFGNSAFALGTPAPTNNCGATSGGGGCLPVVPSPPSITINDVVVIEWNAGTVNANLQVNLSASSAQTITVSFNTASGSATAGSDFISASGMLTFNPGETTKPITVQVIGDTVVESDETFFVNLSSATNATIADGQGMGTIIDNDAIQKLVNISTRSDVRTDDKVMIGGFVIADSGSALTDGSALSSSSKRVLVRSRGPALAEAPFFVTGALSNPRLRLFSGPTVIAQNDNWQDAPSCVGLICEDAAAITATGLDPCQPNPGQVGPPPNCNLESAILISLPPGAYTAIVTGADGGTGVGLVEIFEADVGTDAELINISTRSDVQTGDKVMIGGVVVQGDAPKTVLIRARGPALAAAPFFVAGTLANPTLRLFSGSTVIAFNDNWRDLQQDEILATGLDPCQPNPGESVAPPGCDQESALVLDLPAGAYTAIVSGVGSQTGVGLVEIFEVSEVVVPNVLGNFVGVANTTLSNCQNPLFNGPDNFSSTIAVTSQNGSIVSATGTFTGPMTVNLNISGTGTAGGDLMGSFTFTSPAGSGNGTFTGSLVGNTLAVNLAGLMTSGERCAVSGSASGTR
jgi:hypothetical protein